MKPSDPCEVSIPPSLRLGLQIKRLPSTRPVPQWLLRIPRLVIKSYANRRPVHRSSLRTLIHTPDTLTYPQ